MIPKEWLQKIRHIEMRTVRLVEDLMAGQYHSVFKGRGMDFDEVRLYQPGDEVRRIDGKPGWAKAFRERKKAEKK